MGLIDATQESVLRNFREQILEASTNSQEGHIPSAYSILEILYAIYFDEKNQPEKNFDFVLSKGHASLALYAILQQCGVIGPEWVETFGSFNSNFGGHPDMRKIKGIAASTGSLGHGLPIAVGKVLANRVKNDIKKVICLVGDGEMNEGTIWESLLLASHHKMHELTLIVDFNHSTDRALSLGNLASKFKAFEFMVQEVDGHSVAALREAIKIKSGNMPLCIIANTIKGYGLAEFENNPAWHHLSPKSQQIDLLRKQLR